MLRNAELEKLHMLHGMVTDLDNLVQGLCVGAQARSRSYQEEAAAAGSSSSNSRQQPSSSLGAYQRLSLQQQHESGAAVAAQRITKFMQALEVGVGSSGGGAMPPPLGGQAGHQQPLPERLEGLGRALQGLQAQAEALCLATMPAEAAQAEALVGRLMAMVSTKEAGWGGEGGHEGGSI